MLEQLDLDKVAEAYFHIKTPRDRLEYERLLIRARSEAIPPILQAMLDSIEAAEVHVDKLIAKHVPIRLYHTLGEKEIRKRWAKLSTEPILQDGYEMLQKIEQSGQPVSTLLCVVVIQGDYVMRLAATMLLVMFEALTEEARQGIRLALPLIRSNYKWRRKKQEVLVGLLAIILAHAGEAHWKKLVEDEARFYRLTVEQWIERTTIEGLIELQRNL